MFFDINKNLCDMYVGLNPLALLDYPAEDVFTLISGTINYNDRHEKDTTTQKSGVIRRPASDNWF